MDPAGHEVEDLAQQAEGAEGGADGGCAGRCWAAVPRRLAAEAVSEAKLLWCGERTQRRGAAGGAEADAEVSGATRAVADSSRWRSADVAMSNGVLVYRAVVRPGTGAEAQT